MKRAIDLAEATFELAAATGAGTTKKTERFDLVGATVQAELSSGSYTLEVSNDGTNWQALGSAITADAMVTLSANYRYMRVNTGTAGDGEFTLFAHELLY